MVGSLSFAKRLIEIESGTSFMSERFFISAMSQVMCRHVGSFHIICEDIVDLTIPILPDSMVLLSIVSCRGRGANDNVLVPS